MATPITTSGTTNFRPALAEIIVEAAARIGLVGPAFTSTHLIEARRSMNLILQDWSNNRGVSLAAVDLLQIPMVPGVASYQLPTDTIQLLDVYLRQFTPNTTFTTIGNALTPFLMGGVPMVSQVGDPLITLPGSGSLTCTVGSQIITLNWPAHGLSPGLPIFWNMPISIGGLAIQGFSTVYTVVDANNVTFIAPTPALETQVGMGCTPLLATTSGSPTIDVIMPNHGLNVGSSFSTQVAMTVGGLTIPVGTYTVTAVVNTYDFQFNPALGNASSTDGAFENGGQLQVTSELANNDPIDIILTGMSRTEYASLPNKFDQGRPTSFWLDRLINPTMYVWLVPPPYGSSSAGGGTYYSVAAYRMREMQDANPVNGQVADLPARYIPSFAAALTAALAEKFMPEMFEQKLKLAEMAWDRAATDDIERVPIYLSPAFSGFYR